MFDNCVPRWQLVGCSMTRPFLPAKGMACETMQYVQSSNFERERKWTCNSYVIHTMTLFTFNVSCATVRVWWSHLSCVCAVSFFSLAHHSVLLYVSHDFIVYPICYDWVPQSCGDVGFVCFHMYAKLSSLPVDILRPTEALPGCCGPKNPLHIRGTKATHSSSLIPSPRKRWLGNEANENWPGSLFSTLFGVYGAMN